LLLPTSNYNEEARPSSVDYVPCIDIEHEASTIIENLSFQLRAYPDELLGIIAPSRATACFMWDRLTETELGDVSVLQVSGDHSPFDSNTRICVATVHAAKGLEFRALHVAECNDFEGKPHERNMVYTAITRAKTSLSLYSSGDIPGYLQKALASLSPKSELPSLSNVFGRQN
jgi:superfamily I DNA and RNA helicase